MQRPGTRPHRRTLRPRRGALAAVAVATALSLSACSGPGPGVAASVDGQDITVGQVDDVATLLCAIGGAPGGPEAPLKSARQQALTLLVGNRVALDLVDEDEIDPALLQQAIAQNDQARATLPSSERGTFDAFVRQFSQAQLGLIALGRQSLTEQGQDTSKITDQTAFDEGNRLRQEAAADADIEVDPRFGEVTDGVVGPATDDGLSVPVSELATQAAQDQPSESLGGLLPANQKCSG